MSIKSLSRPRRTFIRNLGVTFLGMPFMSVAPLLQQRKKQNVGFVLGSNSSFDALEIAYNNHNFKITGVISKDNEVTMLLRKRFQKLVIFCDINSLLKKNKDIDGFVLSGNVFKNDLLSGLSKPLFIESPYLDNDEDLLNFNNLIENHNYKISWGRKEVAREYYDCSEEIIFKRKSLGLVHNVYVWSTNELEPVGDVSKSLMLSFFQLLRPQNLSEISGSLGQTTKLKGCDLESENDSYNLKFRYSTTVNNYPLNVHYCHGIKPKKHKVVKESNVEFGCSKGGIVYEGTRGLLLCNGDGRPYYMFCNDKSEAIDIQSIKGKCSQESQLLNWLSSNKNLQNECVIMSDLIKSLYRGRQVLYGS